MGRSTTARRAPGWIIVLAALLLLSSGCGSNFNAQSQQQYQPAVGVSDRTSGVYAINTLVVTNDNGDGTVVSALINQAKHDDTLAKVTAVDNLGAALKVAPLPASGLSLPAGQAVQLADSGAVRLSGSSPKAGTFITLTFTFAQAAPVAVQVPVVINSSTYASVPVGPSGAGTTTTPSP